MSGFRTLAAVAALAACKGGGAPTVSPAAWAEVEAAAAPALASGPPDELARALALIEGVKDDLPLDLRTRDPDEAARIAGELPEVAFDAVEALVRWDQAAGRLPPRTCKPSGTPLATIKLARVALLVAGDDLESPPARAVLRLAARYRGEAVSMLEGMIGSAIADRTREWATGRGLPAGESARRYQPTEDGLRRIIAAEALCSQVLIADARDRDRDRPPPRGTLDELDRALTGAELERVLATDGPLLRRYWIELLADLRARPADPAAIDRKIQARADQLARQTLRHPILSLMAPPIARTITRLRESDDAYRAWLASAPAP